ncbi:hypothetical protein MWU49_14485 [Alcanivorax sp. S6407]|uniref:hypothetical protein n=1 Tax=Alcanivorax sp. S6407 TaxID=2926424 RepID=UPI001FF1EFFA|nr:hypothetical protein [Alcanivorax sp. S6407]MCK0154920.1 hypothetical protein [Alcanivorax sp. S6407]
MNAACFLRPAAAMLLMTLTGVSLADSFADEFARFSAQSARSFEHFSETGEREFARDFIQDWQQFNEALENPLPRQPKPSLQPGVSHQQATHAGAQLNHNDNSNRRSSPPSVSGGFYGHRLITLPLQRLPTLTGTTAEALQQFRQQALASDDFNELIPLFGFMRQRIQADSYAALKLAEELCQGYFLDANSRLACSWILAQTQQLDVRLGERQGRLLLLANSKQEWYEQPFFKVRNDKLYVVNADTYRRTQGATHLQTQPHLDATQPTHASLSRSFLPALENLQRISKGSLEVELDEDFTAYLIQQPLLTVDDYLNDPLPPYLGKQLAKHYGDAQPDEFPALLAEIQGWPYQIDQQQFGMEKPMTLSESLYFPFNDCEDRVYALAALSHHFLHTEIAALRFPTHLSAAVKKAGKWVEADPTYMGATLGMRQPAYRDMEAEWFYPVTAVAEVAP